MCFAYKTYLCQSTFKRYQLTRIAISEERTEASDVL